METSFYPEMGDAKPAADIEASLGHYGRHYYIDTPLKLSGRGITHLNTYISSDLTEHGQRKVGLNHYVVTLAAYAKIKADHSVSREVLLD